MFSKFLPKIFSFIHQLDFHLRVELSLRSLAEGHPITALKDMFENMWFFDILNNK